MTSRSSLEMSLPRARSSTAPVPRCRSSARGAVDCHPRSIDHGGAPVAWMSHRSRESAAAGGIRGRSRMSRSLSSGAHSRDPLARNDGERTTKNLSPSLRGALAPKQSSLPAHCHLFHAGCNPRAASSSASATPHDAALHREPRRIDHRGGAGVERFAAEQDGAQPRSPSGHRPSAAGRLI